MGGNTKPAHDENLSPNLLLRSSHTPCQSHPPACPGIPLGQLLIPAPFPDISLWTLHPCFPFPQWENEGQIITSFGHFNIYLPEGTVRIPAEWSPSWTRKDSHLRSNQLHVLVSDRSKAEWAAWRDTEWVPQWLQENMKALVWDTKWKVSSSETYEWVLGDPCSSSSNTGFTLSAHLRRWMFNTQADIGAGRRAVCPERMSGKWGLLVRSHWLTLIVAAAFFVHNNFLKAFLMVLL